MPRWIRLLERVAELRGADAELGDMREEYGRGRSTLWLGRQVLSVAFMRRRWRRTLPRPGGELFRSVQSDVRYAVRTLRRAPGFALAAIVPIALGIGINTGIFSIFESVALRPLSVPASSELVTVYQQLQGVRRNVSGSHSMLSMAEYERYREARTLTGVMAYSRSLNATLGGESVMEIEGQVVTCNYFEVLQVRMLVGSGFTRANCDDGRAEPTVVLSHDLWMQVFAGDPAIVGTSITLNRQPFAVVGVAPAGFHGTEIVKATFFAPVHTVALLGPNQPTFRADVSWLALIGRRHPDADLEHVRAELSVIAGRLDEEQSGRTSAPIVQPATALSLPEARGDVLPVGAVMLAAFSLVLLIACANVANLLLARGAGRTREIAVRLAVGASRARLVRQLLTESLIIACAGGIAGVALSWWSFQGLLAFAVSSLPGMVPALAVNLQPDMTVLWFAIALTMTTGVAFGLLPALQASKPDVQSAIKQETGGSAWRTGWLRGSLMTVQVAVCMLLLIMAGLLLRALYEAQTVEPGFDYRNVSVVSFDVSGAAEDRSRTHLVARQVMERLGSLPGVGSVAQAGRIPLSPGRTGTMFRLASQERWHEVDFNTVSPEYFSLLRIPIVRGRAFTRADLEGGPGVAIVTEATARRYWPGVDPLGQTVFIGGPDPGQDFQFRIVGVTADAQIGRIARTESSYMYLPATPESQMRTRLTLLVRSEADFASIGRAIRASIGQVDAGLAVNVTRLEENLDLWRTISRLTASLSTSIGLLALVLASVGVYGVVSYVVSRRVREVGIRMMLGATAGDVLRMILRQTMRPVAIGLVAGVAMAAAASRILEGVLFGVSPLDPVAFLGAASFLIGVAAAASLVPARRAVNADTSAILRYE